MFLKGHEDPRGDLTKVTAVYRILGMDSVTVRRDGEFRAAVAGVLAMDLYHPPVGWKEIGRPLSFS